MTVFPSLRALSRPLLALFVALLAVPMADLGRTPVNAALLTSTTQASPVGRWKASGDKNRNTKAIVFIREENGKLNGTIEALFDPPVPHPTCYVCSGANKDQPLVGLEVLWGFHADGGEWAGGQVLDPETGGVYRALLVVEDGGRKLRLRGSIGIPLLGRTVHWVRAE